MNIYERTLKSFHMSLMTTSLFPSGGTCSPETSTSIIKNLEMEVVRSFIKKCYYKDHKHCIFCHRPIVRLTLQNSRFIRSGLNKNKDKDKDEDKDGQTEAEAEREEREAEENGEEDSNIILDAQSYITSEQVHFTRVFLSLLNYVRKLSWISVVVIILTICMKNFVIF